MKLVTLAAQPSAAVGAWLWHSPAGDGADTTYLAGWSRLRDGQRALLASLHACVDRLREHARRCLRDTMSLFDLRLHARLSHLCDVDNIRRVARRVTHSAPLPHSDAQDHHAQHSDARMQEQEAVRALEGLTKRPRVLRCHLTLRA